MLSTPDQSEGARVGVAAEARTAVRAVTDGVGRGMRRRLCAWMASVVVCVAHAVAAPPDLTLDVSFGWPMSGKGGRSWLLVPERGAPVVVRVAGPDGGPLAEAFDGIVRLRYLQDATQYASVSVRVAGTPGKVASAQAVVCVPRALQEVEAELLDARGRVLGRATYSAQMRRDSDLPLPEVSSTDALVVASVGMPAGVPDSVLAALRPRDDQGWNYTRRYASAVLPASEVPVAAPALSSLAALVVSAQAELDPRAMAAIRQWVLGGGRLLVMADGPGDGWRRWLPPGPQGDMVTLGDSRVTPLPADLARAAGRPLPLPRDSTGPTRRPDGSVVPAETREVEAGVPAASVVARPMRLTARGLAEGWSSSWATETIGLRGDERAAPALLAWGPVGFGMVAVLGVEPRRTNVAGSDPAADRVWDHALRPLLADAAPLGRARDIQPAYYSEWYIGSGESRATAASIESALNLLGDEPPVDHVVALAVTLSMGVLVLAVGPVDYFLLGARRRHRSWLTALGWVALASAGAFAGPAVLRGGESRVQRLSLVDLLEPAAEPGAGREEPPALPALAFDSSLLVIWAGQTGRASVLGESGDPIALGPSDGTSWRGASSVVLNQWDQPGLLIPGLDFVHRQPTVDATGDPWGGLLSAQAAATQPAPGGLDLRRWTLRAMLHAGRSEPLVRVRAERDDSGRVVFRVSGLPEGARLGRAAACLSPRERGSADLRGVVWAQALQPGEPEEEPRGRRTITLVALPEPAAEGLFHFLSNSEPVEAPSADDPPGTGFNPGAALFLPGAAARQPAIDARLESGRWAVLLMDLDGLPLGLNLSPSLSNGRSSRRVVVRAVVPIQSAEGSDQR